MIDHRLRASEDGWVMVPVMILIVVAIGVGLAVLAVVDEQTQQSRSQRDVDAAQTLAEGVISATTRVVAADQSAATWRATGGCQKVTGDLSTAPSPASTALDDRIAREVQSRFAASHDYASTAARKTTWRVDLCPVQGSEGRWDEAFLTRTVSAPATQTALWVRGQASVRGPVSASAPAKRVNSRAVVSEVRQQTVDFAPPKDVAVGTGAFSTDVGASLSGLLTSDQSIAGKLLNGVLGTQPLIKDSSAHIGVRCGLLSRLSSGSLCLAGTLAGLSASTKSIGLGVLNGPLGIDRFQALPSWTMAPPDAVDAWRTEAKRAVTYSPTVLGYGNVRTKSVSGTRTTCPTGSDDKTVVFIEQVGDGDQYCDLTGGQAKIFIVARGGVRVTGSFKGVVYALNLQECTQPDGSCSAADRANGASREVVRIDKPGNVKGQVWADGAGGLVGIYPSASGAPSKSALLNVGGSSGVCGLPAVGSLVSTLTTALNGVLGLVGNTLGMLGTSPWEEVRYPNGASSGCDLLRGQLGSLPTNDVVNLFGTQTTQSIVTSEHRTWTCVKKVLLTCNQWSQSAWSPRDTTNALLPPLVTGASSSVLDQLTGVLGDPLSGYTAIEYDSSARAKATSHIPQGASPVSGTYRNVTSVKT